MSSYSVQMTEIHPDIPYKQLFSLLRQLLVYIGCELEDSCWFLLTLWRYNRNHFLPYLLIYLHVTDHFRLFLLWVEVGEVLHQIFLLFVHYLKNLLRILQTTHNVSNVSSLFTGPENASKQAIFWRAFFRRFNEIIYQIFETCLFCQWPISS